LLILWAFFVDTYGTSNVDLNDGEIARNLENIFDMRPYAIVSRFGLKNPIFEKTAAYGHFGRSPYIKEVEVLYKSEDTSFKEKRNGIDIYSKDVEFFGWEKLDYVDKVKSAFGI